MQHSGHSALIKGLDRLKANGIKYYTNTIQFKKVKNLSRGNTTYLFTLYNITELVLLDVKSVEGYCLGLRWGCVKIILKLPDR